MGGNQSSNSHDSAGDIHQVQQQNADYYGLLGLTFGATEDEIKKAYRKRALELHPDRNYGNVEETTSLFAGVQAAYEVLSDPQERAWYDSHRDSILRGDNDAPNEYYEHDIRLTTSDDILRSMADLNGQVDFSNSASGFYSKLRGLFDGLAREEELISEWEKVSLPMFPSFGGEDDGYDDVVRPFYVTWGNFSTRKKFSWKDVYRLSEASDRRVRRMMVRENKRARENGVREFNDIVRSLVAFVRKRDPRYKPNTQSEAERLKVLKDATAAQAARSRAANQAQLVEHVLPAWAQPMEQDHEDNGETEWEYNGTNECDLHFECVVCQKLFKSEKQFEAHEKSRKHVRAVGHLRQQMQEEDVDLQPGRELVEDKAELRFTTPDEASQSDAPDLLIREEKVDVLSRQGIAVESPVDENFQTSEQLKDLQADCDETEYDDGNPFGSDLDDEYAPRETVEARILGSGGRNSHLTQSPNHKESIQDLRSDSASTALDEDGNQRITPRLGKAKLKRAKKAAQMDSNNEPRSDLACATCHAMLPSKTQLHSHIKTMNHAQQLQKATGQKKNRKM